MHPEAGSRLEWQLRSIDGTVAFGDADEQVGRQESAIGSNRGEGISSIGLHR
jgi:hypothetical protein